MPGNARQIIVEAEGEDGQGQGARWKIAPSEPELI